MSGWCLRRAAGRSGPETVRPAKKLLTRRFPREHWLGRVAPDRLRLDRGLPADCEECFAGNGTYSEAYLRWLLDNYGDEHEIGLIVGDGDYTSS